jgi:cell pole-organizing protein PopZ
MEGTSEASMEEILASIRKIIADEPAPSPTMPESPPNPKGFDLPAAREPAREPMAPEAPASRSSGLPFFRSASPAATPAVTPADIPLPMPPRSRAAAIDDDLAGLIETPAPAAKAPSPAPAPAAVSSSVEAAREKWANLINPGGPATAAAAPTPTPAVMPSLTALSVKPEAPVSAPPTASVAPAVSTGLFAPRKGGFYPPQEPVRTEPTLPLPTPAPAAAPIPSPAPVSTGFIPMPKAPEPVVTPSPSWADGLDSATKPAAPSLPQSNDPVLKAPEPVAAAPDALPPQTASEASAASARALDDLVAGLNKTAAAPAGAPEPVIPAPVVSAPVVPSPVVEAVKPVVSEAVAAPSVTPAPVAPATAAPAIEAIATPSPAVTQGRSFEDVVADMLRPLLEKWIDENMPRIVERALQRDASLAKKPEN